MSFSLLASAKANGSSGGTTSAIDTTGAKLIVIEAAFSGSVTISDNKGNTYTAATIFNGTTPNIQFFYCIGGTVGSGHTFTAAGSVASIVVSAWSVTNTPALDSQSSANSNSGTQSQFGSTSFTPTTDNCLLIGGAGFPNAVSAFTAGSGWTAVDIQNYVGGTNYGSSQVYKVQGAATAVPTTEHPASWTGSTGFTYNGIAFKESVASSLSVTTPVAFEVHQRSGSTGSIQITGTVSGATEDIEASFNGGAYQTIATAVAAGSFSGTLTGQAQGQGTLTVRKKTTTSTSATVANVGIGDVFLIGGDSISEGRGTNAQSYSHATLKAAAFRQDNAWIEGNDGIDTGTSNGSHWPLLATQIMADQGVPVAFISCGTGSTDVAGSHNEWAKPNSGYSSFTTQVTNSTAASVKAVLMHLGPNAVVNATTLSLATYNTAIDTLAANLAADVAGAPKLHLGIFGECSTGSPPDRRAALDNLRGAIIQAQGDNANVKPGPCLIDLDYADGVHPQSDVQLQAVAQRWWIAIKESLYGGSGGRGPRLSSASWNAGRNQLTVIFDRALKTGLTHSTGCWQVSDNGSAMTVSSIAYHGSNPNAIVLTMSAAAVGTAGTTTLTFASGDDAIGLVVPRSTDITLAVGGTTTIPAEPIYAAAVGEVDVTAPTLSSPIFTGTGLSTGTAGVTTNEANGTLYCVVTTSATPPTGAQVRAGQDATGAAASYASSQTITSAGSKTFGATGLSSGTNYYAHFQHRDVAGNDSVVSTSAGGATSSPPKVTLTLTTNGTTPAATLTGLKWAFFDQNVPNNFGAPVAKGTLATTDGSGVLTINITGTGLTAGQVGWLIVTDSDGTTTQSPMKGYSGPAVVS